MKTYELWTETGPKRRKTVVHVPGLGGCTARGDTTDTAVKAAPLAISRYLRVLARHGESIDPDATFRTRVAQVMTDGWFLGSAFLPPDLKPLTPRDIQQSLKWLGWHHEDLRRITVGLTAKELEAKPSEGRAIGHILRHLLAEGAYLRGISGVSRIQREVDERGRDPHDALDEMLRLERERLEAMTTAERSEVVMRGQMQWTARSAVRKMLGHAWEHYVEIAERLGLEP